MSGPEQGWWLGHSSAVVHADARCSSLHRAWLPPSQVVRIKNGTYILQMYAGDVLRAAYALRPCGRCCR